MSTLKRVLALSLALVMALSLSVFAVEFKDQDQIDTACDEAINMLVALNVLNEQGKGDGVFDPAGEIKRGEAAKMIYVLLNNGVDDLATLYTGRNTFGDVPAGSWYEGYIEYCYSVGIVAGRGINTVTGKPTFDPEAPITGYEWAKMLLVVGNYDPAIHQFTGDNWQNNVLKFANSTSLSDDYAVLMSAYAPRQWAALMMSNLIIKVEYARYLGDNLVTGSGMGDGGELVGAKLLGLKVFDGKLTQTKTAKLGGVDEYDFAKVVTNEFAPSSNPDKTDIINVSYDITNAWLGQEVRVIAKQKNTALTGAVSVAPSNVTVLSVYPTGNSIVVDTTIDKLAVTAYDYKNDMGNDWAEGASKNGKNDAISFTLDGTKTTYQFYPNTVITNDDFAASITAFNKLVDNIFINNYKAIGQGYGSANTSAGIHDFIKSVTDYYANRKDAVKLIDFDGDGTFETILIAETSYNRVSTINASRISLTGGISGKIEEFNFTNGTPERNDVIAVTKNYSTGECVYDVRILEVTSAKVSEYTGDAGSATSVTLDGTAYKPVNAKISVTGSDTFINKDHGSFYIDNGFVVYSSDATLTGSSAPSDLAIITAVGTDTAVSGLYKTLSVQYMKTDGTKTTAIYDTRTEDCVGETDDYNVDGNVNTNGLLFAQAALREAMNATANNDKQLVQVVTTSYGVSFIPVDTNTYTNLTFDVARGGGGFQYDGSNNLFKVGTKTRDLSPNAMVFVSYYTTANGPTAPTFTSFKVEDMKSFTAEADDKVQGMLYNSYGEIVALYLDLGNEANTDKYTGSDKSTYLVVTGNPSINNTDGKVYVDALFADNTTAKILVDKVNFGATAQTVTSDLVARLKLRMVEYTVTSGKYTLTTIVGTTADATKIDESTDTSFKTADAHYGIDEDTVFFYIEDGSVTAYQGSAVFGGANSTFITSRTSSSLLPMAEGVVVNGDGDNVYTENVAPKAPSSSTRAANLTKVEFEGKDITLTFDKDMDVAAVAPAVLGASGFNVTINRAGGGEAAESITVAAAAASKTVILTVSGAALTAADTVKVAYNEAGGIRDTDGVLLPSFPNVAGVLIDTIAPKLVVADPTYTATTITLTFDKDLDAATFTANNFSLNAGNTSIATGAVILSAAFTAPNKVVITLDKAMASNDKFQVTYTAGTLKGVNGTAVATESTAVVTLP